MPADISSRARERSGSPPKRACARWVFRGRAAQPMAACGLPKAASGRAMRASPDQEAGDAVDREVNGYVGLNVTFVQLLLLRRNGQFPAALTDDGYGDNDV